MFFFLSIVLYKTRCYASPECFHFGASVHYRKSEMDNTSYYKRKPNYIIIHSRAKYNCIN